MKRLCLFLLFILSSCDFTPRLHRHILRADDYAYSNRYEEAIREYEHILTFNPSNDIKMRVYYNLGELYSVNLANNEKGLEYFSKIKYVTEDILWEVKSEERMGEINFSFMRDYEASIKNYQKLVNFKPALEQQEFYQYRLALSYMKKGDLEIAQKKMISIQKNSSHKHYLISFYHLGMIAFEQKRWKSAINHWENYLNLEKDQNSIIQTKFLMANAYETMEELKKAYNIYYSILGKYPNTQVIKNRLESIYARRVARKR